MKKWPLVQEMYYLSKNGERIFFNQGDGAYLFDEDGKSYIDFWNGFGSVLLGYNHPEVVAELRSLMDNKAFSLQCPTRHLQELGELVLSDYPGKDKTAFFTTGTSAVRAAVMMALNYTGKKIILTSGYHGWDPMWTRGVRPFEANDYGVIDFFFILEKFEELASKYQEEIGAVIISPDHSYFSEEYFKKLYSICKKYKLVTIVDDVKCGYRYRCGASIDPEVFLADLYLASKGIGNGARISCVIGNEDIMEKGNEFCYTSFYDVYSLVSAICTLKNLKKDNVQERIREQGDLFISDALKQAKALGVPMTIRGNGNLFQFIFENDELAEAFYEESIQGGLAFFKDDNQCLSYAFDAQVNADAKKRLHHVLEALRSRFPTDMDKSVPDARIFQAAFSQADGCAEAMSYEEKIKFIQDMYNAIL